MAVVEEIALNISLKQNLLEYCIVTNWRYYNWKSNNADEYHMAVHMTVKMSVKFRYKMLSYNLQPYVGKWQGADSV